MRNLIIVVTLIGCPEWALAQDKWFASDKMKHFGGGAAISGGAYAVAVPVTKRRGWRVAIGTTVGVGAGAEEAERRSRPVARAEAAGRSADRGAARQAANHGRSAP